MIGAPRDAGPADVPALDALLQSAYGVTPSYERRLHEGLANGAARTFVIDGAAGPIGMVTLHDYVTIGYVALMGVGPAFQGRGVGRRLMQALIAASGERGHAALALESSEAGATLYESLGFVALAGTLGFAGPCPGSTRVDTRIRRAVVADGERIAAYDAGAFGGDRAPSVRAWLGDPRTTVYVAGTGERIRGYVVARDGRVGPWIAESQDMAAALFDAARAALDGTGFVFVPEENRPARAIVAESGWQRRSHNTHMVRGQPLVVTRRTIYGLISLGEG